jgi:cell division protein FtsA
MKVRRVFTNSSGAHLEGYPIRGVLKLSPRGTEITTKEIKRVIEVAKTIHMPIDREIVYAVTQQFLVDGEEHIQNPLGLCGTQLEVELYVVTAFSSAIENMIKAIDYAGYEVEDIVPSPLATSFAILYDYEKEQGVALIDIGAGTVDIAIFAEGVLKYANSFALGGDLVTKGIAKGLRIPLNHAERLKVRHGIVSKGEGISEDEKLIYKCGNEFRQFDRKRLCELIFPQVDSILDLIKSQLHSFRSGGDAGLGIVITGGVAHMEGFLERAEESINLPVRMGSVLNPEGIQGTSSLAHKLDFATGIGLVHFGIEKHFPAKLPSCLTRKNALNKIIFKAKELFYDYF